MTWALLLGPGCRLGLCVILQPAKRAKRQVKSNQGRTSNFEISIFIFKFLQEKSNYMERFQEFKEVISGQISLVILFFGSSSWMSVSLSRAMKR